MGIIDAAMKEKLNNWYERSKADTKVALTSGESVQSTSASLKDQGQTPRFMNAKEKQI